VIGRPYYDQRWKNVDTTTSAGKALFGMLGGFAEFERDLIIERTNAGLAHARAEGTKSGRPFGRPRIGKDVEDAIRAQLKRGTGIHKTARLVAQALKLDTLGSGTVQRVRASLRPGGGRRRRSSTVLA
jgi:DNA invertase Pin-like site-specific DNA recombinase